MDYLYQLTPQTLADYRRAVMGRVSKIAHTPNKLGNLAVAALAIVLPGIVFVALLLIIKNIAGAETTGQSYGMPLFVGLMGGMASAVAILILRNYVQQKELFRPDGPTLAPHRLNVSDDGVRVSGQNFENAYQWAFFTDVTAENSVVILWLEPAMGVSIPKAAFGDGDAYKDFERFAVERIEQARGVAKG